MRRTQAAEIRMLREIAWFFLRNRKCAICKQRFVPEDEAIGLKFGHRKHPPLKIRVTAHHKDEDRENNVDKNLDWVHRRCHKGHHLNQARKKVLSWDCLVSRPSSRRPWNKVIRASTKRRAIEIAFKKKLEVLHITERR